MLVALLLAQGLHGGFSLGVGTAYDGVGARVEVGTDHLGLFAGARFYPAPRQGFFVSLNFTDSLFSNWANYDLRGPGAGTVPGSIATLTLLGGYRWNFAPLFVEAGAGGGGYRERQPGGRPSYGPIPDVALGVGVEL